MRRNARTGGLGDRSRALEHDPVAADALPILARVETHTRRRRLAWTTAVFSVATGLSRILGLVREIVARLLLRRQRHDQRVHVAFQVPNLDPLARRGRRALVGASCRSSASCSRRASANAPGAWPRPCFWLLLLGLGAITALLIVFAPLVMRAVRRPGGDKQLATSLARLLFPIVVLLGVSGIIVGILNSYERVHRPGADAGVLEPRDHRRPRPRRPARGRSTRSSTSTRSRS